MFIAQFITML